jgi:EAL domain-containing protein (putative c-di-GMP-specific phosphodiesterase class I)
MLDTSTITEMDALVRWEHPRRGLLMSSEFIQDTEDTGLIVPFEKRVLEEPCRRARERGFQNGHFPPMTMYVSLSMGQVQDPDLVDKIERVLRRAALDANQLKPEITGPIVIEDGHHVIGVLRDQCAVEVRIALDDFHSGFSSLNYVKDLPVDDAIVRLIVDFAHTPDLEVTVEGVENDRQVASLTAMRCDPNPGFLLLETAIQRGSGEVRND